MNDYILNELEKVSKESTSYGTIAKYLLETDDITKVSIKDIVQNCYVSISTPTRLAKYLGYDGFKELKYELKIAKKYQKKLGKNFLNPDSYLEKLNDSLSNTFNYISEKTVATLVEKLNKSNKINMFAVADTGLIAKDFAYKLERVNKVVNCYSDYHLQQVYAKLSTKDDLCIGISYSGTTKEVLNNLKMCKENGSKTILITSRDIEADYIDHIINISSSEQMARKYSMISRTTILTVLDIIYLKYIEVNKDEIENILTKTKINK